MRRKLVRRSIRPAGIQSMSPSLYAKVRAAIRALAAVPAQV